jgi:GAF domain-containing protein
LNTGIPQRAEEVFSSLSTEISWSVSYAGYEGQQDAARIVFANIPEDPVGQYMFRLLGEREAILIPNVDAAELPVKFPSRRSYQTIIATAVMAGESPYGILTLDAPQAESLGQPDLEIMKTLANLLGVGLALAARGSKTAVQIPAQSSPEVTVGTDLLASVGAH